MSTNRLRALAASLAVALVLTPAPAAHAAAVATGTLTGTLTTAKGAPAAGVYLELKPAVGDVWMLPQAWTDENGHYTLDLPPGRYKVGFHFHATMSTQWVPRATRDSRATWFTVTEGGTTVVDEVLFPTGGMTVTLAGHTDFCVEAIGDRFLSYACTTSGEVALTDLPVNLYMVTALVDENLVGWGDAEVTEDAVTPLEIVPT
ncbi:carboxypeptidase regulatory-like domain-containing protein [Paractinoplanes rishiriensis]|uniref:carboxypeptidase regulatory-like domain-containing protein n=1 Tax=Paractinoplanes rishiriensis TaxID=1050105 RepID=UPI0019406642|nr:carboxypeptidase regulatory-like domain-containing protein [Actinoplanes rishiriensis]